MYIHKHTACTCTLCISTRKIGAYPKAPNMHIRICSEYSNNASLLLQSTCIIRQDTYAYKLLYISRLTNTVEYCSGTRLFIVIMNTSVSAKLTCYLTRARHCCRTTLWIEHPHFGHNHALASSSPPTHSASRAGSTFTSRCACGANPHKRGSL